MSHGARWYPPDLCFQPGQMAAGDVAERHDRTQRDAGARVVAAHDAGAVIADGIKTRDWVSAGIEHAADGIGGEAIEGAEISHQQFERVIRTLADRCDVRIRLVLGIAEKAIEGAAATAEL